MATAGEEVIRGLFEKLMADGAIPGAQLMVQAANEAPAGNGAPAPKRGPGRPRTREKRVPTDYNLFQRQWWIDHPDVPFREAQKLISADWKGESGDAWKKANAKKAGPKATKEEKARAAAEVEKASAVLDAQKSEKDIATKAAEASIKATKISPKPKTPPAPFTTAAEKRSQDIRDRIERELTKAKAEGAEPTADKILAAVAVALADMPPTAAEEIRPADPLRSGGPPALEGPGGPIAVLQELASDPSKFEEALKDPAALKSINEILKPFDARFKLTKEGIFLRRAHSVFGLPPGVSELPSKEQAEEARKFLAENLEQFAKEASEMAEAASASSGKEEGGILIGGFDFKSATDNLRRRLKGIKEALSGVRKNWPPDARAVLEKYGDIEFTEVKVCRKPLSEALQKLIRTAKMPEAGDFDKFYHLSIWFKIGNHKWLRLDKREKLHAVIEDRDTEPGAKCIPVEIGEATPRTVNAVTDKALKAVGTDRFFVYRSLSFNCQRFVADLIESNDMRADIKWILQPVKGLVSPIVERIANLATDLKSRASLLVEGFGFKDQDSIDEEFMIGLGKLCSMPEIAPVVKVPEATFPPQMSAKTREALGNLQKEVVKDSLKVKCSGGKCEASSSEDDCSDMFPRLRHFASKRLGCEFDDKDMMRMLSDERVGGVLIAGFKRKLKKKRKATPWQKALMEWNRGRDTWKIPRKGTKGYSEVQALKQQFM